MEINKHKKFKVAFTSKPNYINQLELANLEEMHWKNPMEMYTSYRFS